MLSPSDIVVRPASLAERLAAEAKADQPTLEPTPTIMAERFAPEGQRNESRAAADTPPVQGRAAERHRAATPGRWLLIASLLVSLVPTAIILLLLWQGAIRLPGPAATSIVIEREDRPESQQASMAAVAAVPAVTPVPTVVIEPKPEVVLSAPGRIEAKAGEEVAFDIAIDSAESLPARSIIAIRQMPEGATFSQGRAYDATEWNLRPDEIGDLKLRLPELAGAAELRVELMAADGTVLASSTTLLDVALDPKSALILRSDETERVDDLIEHGQKMIDVGYFAGARAYFKRAAEAGSGEAALQLGATYDPEFIVQIGAHGIKGDPDQAQAWYQRAKQLGVEGAAAKLEALKKRWTNGGGAPVQTTEAEMVSPPAAGAAADTESVVAETAAETASETAPSDAIASLPEGKEEWVALVGYANVRAAPSSDSDSLRVAQKGAKLKVTGRQGNWVQVSDPETDEVGWIYSRYIETAQAPAR